MDPLTLLERTDKHYLGCGDAIIFAPRFPRWLALPGFWDEIDVHQYKLSSLFTVTFLDAAGASPGGELRARASSRRCSSVASRDDRWMGCSGTTTPPTSSTRTARS